MALKLVKDKGCAIDGGAGDGSWSKVLWREFSEVHSFEPGRSFTKLYQEWLSQSSGSHATTVCLWRQALMDMDGRYTRILPTKVSAGHYMLDDHGLVEGTTIDSRRLSRCDLLKLTVDGAEVLALRGAWKTVKRFSPIIVVEVSDLRKEYDIGAGELEGWFKRHKYEFHYGDDGHRIYKPVE